LINFIKQQTALATVELLSKINRFPLTLYKIKHDAKLRSLFIGDAGHKVHPLAGQGLNLGLGDIQMLENLISDKRIIDLGQENNIKKYVISRSVDESLVMNLTDRLDEALVNNSDVFSNLFKYPIKLIENSELLKKAIVRKMI
jgi:2-polyprenyl-6-methoxyphenol hydroxylase-like FAD-dependent oxidoreductase